MVPLEYSVASASRSILKPAYPCSISILRAMSRSRRSRWPISRCFLGLVLMRVLLTVRRKMSNRHFLHRDRDLGNYCNLSPLMDILFGPYHRPDHEPDRFGINEPTPRTYWG